MGTQPVPCGLSRRSVLGGALGAAFVLAACEGSPSTPPAAGSTGGSGPAGGPTATQSTPAGPPGSLVALDAVPVGAGVIAPGPVLVVRATEDEITAYDAVCPHQRVTIGTPAADGTITCPGHGARFAAGDGTLLSGPAPTGLRSIAVEIRDGFVVRA